MFFLTSIFLLNFTIRIIISPLLPTILHDMSLTGDQAGSLFLMSALGYFITLICSGFVSENCCIKNHRPVCNHDRYCFYHHRLQQQPCHDADRHFHYRHGCGTVSAQWDCPAHGLTCVLMLNGISTLSIGLLSGTGLQIAVFFQPIFSVCFFPPEFSALSNIGA